MKLLGIFLVLWNIIVFFIYGADKLFAAKGMYRVSEKCLLLLAFSGGGTGALLGMYIFRHKTKKLKFKICVPLALIINTAVIIPLFWRAR